MGTVKDVLEIIGTLTADERQQVRDYLQEDEWDKQMDEDAENGRLDAFFAEGIKEFEQGKCKRI